MAHALILQWPPVLRCEGWSAGWVVQAGRYALAWTAFEGNWMLTLSSVAPWPERGHA